MTKQKDNYKLNKWFFIFLFTILLILSLLFNKQFDNDIWYLLREGKYIFENGIYHIDPLSMHSGLQVVVQNWLSATTFYIIYSLFGQTGILLIILISFFFISLLLYKICMLISNRNHILSSLIMFINAVILVMYYIVSRPQIISYIILLSLIYILELYIKTENKKYLFWLPILSLIEINMHASLWWMIFLFTLPYVIDSFKIDALKLQGYKKKPLFIAIILAFLVGFINPYGYKAITYIFTSFSDKYMHLFIGELLPFNICGGSQNIIMFSVFLIIILIYIFFREGKIRIRYICLFCGTLLLSFISTKGFSNFILVAIFPLAYFFKDIIPNNKTNFLFQKKYYQIFCILSIISFILFISLFIFKTQSNLMINKIEIPMKIVKDNFNPEKTKIYSSFNNGGFVEFEGYKPYMDPRAEVFIKKNNKKEDLFEEFYKLQHNELDIEKFLQKYDFDALIVDNEDILFTNLYKFKNYALIYYENNIKLYIKSEFSSQEGFSKYPTIYEFTTN